MRHALSRRMNEDRVASGAVAGEVAIQAADADQVRQCAVNKMRSVSLFPLNYASALMEVV